MSKIKLSKKYIYKICKDALKEDLYPSGDITSKLLKNTKKMIHSSYNDPEQKPGEKIDVILHNII